MNHLIPPVTVVKTPAVNKKYGHIVKIVLYLDFSGLKMNLNSSMMVWGGWEGGGFRMGSM